MDQDEKQYAVRLLVQMGRVAVEPIIRFLRTEPEVTWPVRALREILPPEEFHSSLKNLLSEMASVYTRWPEAKVALIQHLSDEAFPLMRPIVFQYLQDDDDDVCIAAVDYLARHGDEEIREKLIETFLALESRPRVRGRILEIFCESEWPVKGYRKKVDETISEPFYLTSKGTIKRRPAAAF
jgi:HEAT repeat protein